MITQEEFEGKCKDKGFRVPLYYYDKFVIPLMRHGLDDDFYETTRILIKEENGAAPTICKVLRLIDRCCDNGDNHNYIHWLTLIGQKMGKRMYDVLQERKRQLGGLNG